MKLLIIGALVVMVFCGFSRIDKERIDCPGREITESVYTRDQIEVGIVTHCNYPQLRNSNFSFNNNFEDDLYTKRYGLK